MRNVLMTILTWVTVLQSDPAVAYLGPGAGLGMIGSLIAIAVVAIVVVLGLVIYPIRLLRKKRLQGQSKDRQAETAE